MKILNLPNIGDEVIRPLSIVVRLKSHAADGKTRPTLLILNAEFKNINPQSNIILILNFPKPVKPTASSISCSLISKNYKLIIK